jgi:hypothetical protein
MDTFSAQYGSICEQIADLARTQPRRLDALQPGVASDYAPFFWHEELGADGVLDDAVISRAAYRKTLLYGGRLFVIVPVYVSSICQEQCLYCNYRAGNKGIGVERKRLSDEELKQEALFLVEERDSACWSWSMPAIPACALTPCAAMSNCCETCSRLTAAAWSG